MTEMEELRRRLAEWRPAPYEGLPDIDLYKDQVLAYMQRQQMPGESADELTGAMINNYIKSGVLPRPEGKRYQRPHLAALTAICQLKQVLSVGDTSRLLEQQPDIGDTQAFYTRYLARLNEALAQAAKKLPDAGEQPELARLALDLALQSYVDRLVARELLEMLSRKQATEKPVLPKAEKEPKEPKEKKDKEN